MIKDIIKKKSLGRILMNKYCEKYLSILSGSVIDFGSGKGASYDKYFNSKTVVTRTDYDKKKNPDIVIDLNKSFPVNDNYFNNAVMFNSVYILENPRFSLQEVNRILKPGGTFLLTSPFIFNEAPEPVDYWRFTSLGLRKILEESGFREIEVYKIGERFTSAVSLINPFRHLFFLNLALYPLALLLDKLLPQKIKDSHPSPLGYFVVCKK